MIVQFTTWTLNEDLFDFIIEINSKEITKSNWILSFLSIPRHLLFGRAGLSISWFKEYSAVIGVLGESTPRFALSSNPLPRQWLQMWNIVKW